MSVQTLQLREYQTAARQAVAVDLAQGHRRLAVVMATGLGKTVVFTRQAIDYVRNDALGRKALILAHRDELVTQAAKKVHEAASGLDLGIVQAGQNEIGAQIIVGSVQTLRNRGRLDPLVGRVGLVIVDEAHHSAADSYQSIMTTLGCFDPAGDVISLGYSATLDRTDGRELGRIWEKVSYERDVIDGILDGYLCDVTGHRVTLEGLDLDGVKRSRGDLQAGSLAEALEKADARHKIVDAYEEHTPGMPGLCFVPSVRLAEQVLQTFRARGHRAAMIWGEMPKDARRMTIARFEEGTLDILINCMVLTEGTDLPRAQVAMIARPTENAALYVQMVGRVLRPYPGKELAHVLDFAGASAQHRLATLANLTRRALPPVAEGSTLRQVAVEVVRRRAPGFENYVISSYEVDLFSRSRMAWLQTKRGRWFLPVLNAVVFIWPGDEPGTYGVGIRPQNRSGGRWVRRGLGFEAAMAWGERAANRYADSYLSQHPEDRSWSNERRAGWRRRPATAPQIDRLEALKVSVGDATVMTRGQAADLINVAKISPLLD